VLYSLLQLLLLLLGCLLLLLLLLLLCCLLLCLKLLLLLLLLGLDAHLRHVILRPFKTLVRKCRTSHAGKDEWNHDRRNST
jgi:hypothetical protein